MRRPIRLALPLVPVVALVLSAGGVANGAVTTCSTAPADPALELVYRLEAGEKGVTPQSRDVAVEIVCRRLAALGVSDALVEAVGEDEIRVVLPRAADLSQEVVEGIGAVGQLHFYDWEPNLIGRELLIGGNPGSRPPVVALRAARREWRAAGRNLRRQATRGLMLSGALPTLFAAVKLASRQKPRRGCRSCSASAPRFYLFDRTPARRPIAGPVADRATLRALANAGPDAARGIVLGVPVGTTVISERPTDRSGEPLAHVAPGWYALRDRPALAGDDVLEPKQERDGGLQAVSFLFTPEGRVAFRRLTQRIAFRGGARALGPVTRRRAEELSGRFAIVFDEEMKVRPLVDFTQYPDGIDPRSGAKVVGFGSAAEARRVATFLEIGALPVAMTLLRERSLLDG